MTALPRTAAILAAVLALSAGPDGANTPDGLVHEANRAFAAGDVEAAVRLHSAARERTGDPGLVAFNRAAVLFALGDYREAELEYLRALADAEIPPTRRIQALYNRGVCLLKRGGGSAIYQTAIAGFEQCLQGAEGDAALAADARHNLEVAKILWGQARLREAARPRANDPLPEVEYPEPRPFDDPAGNERIEVGSRADGGRDPRPQPGPTAGSDAGKRPPTPTDAKSPGSGTLPVIPDSEVLQPMSPEDTRALLRAAETRLDKDRKSTARMLAGPERPNVRDW